MGIILVSGAMNAAFALPMKYSRTWKWENQWLVFSVVGILFVPWALAFALVPQLTHVYAEVAPRALWLALAFGLLWGIAQVTFGLSLRIVGVALTFAVVSGLASLTGSLIPMLALYPEELFRPRGLMLLLSIPFLIVGLTLYAIAGRPARGGTVRRPTRVRNRAEQFYRRPDPLYFHRNLRLVL